MNWSFSPCSSLWVMPKVEWWSHFSPRDSNLWKVSLMMISWNCNITLMNEMSNMAAPKAHLSSFSSYFPGNHSRKINKVGSAILNSILMIYSVFLRLFWMSNMAAPKAHLSSSFLGNHSREINKVSSWHTYCILTNFSMIFFFFEKFVKYGSAKSASFFFFFFSGKSQ